MNKVLYKYGGINENTENILKDNRIWYANVRSLNDPNEGLIKDITDTKVKDFIMKTRMNQMQGFVFGMFMAHKSNTTFYGLNNKEIRNLQKRIRSKNGTDRRYKYINSFLEEKLGKGFSSPEGLLDSIHTGYEKVKGLVGGNMTKSPQRKR